VSHTYLYKKLDEYGKNHDQDTLTQVAKEGERMKETKLRKDGNPSAVPATCQARRTGRKIVFDNFDFKQLVHHMTEDHQNIANLGHSCICGEPSIWQPSTNRKIRNKQPA
jgi:hypothetical protein